LTVPLLVGQVAEPGCVRSADPPTFAILELPPVDDRHPAGQDRLDLDAVGGLALVIPGPIQDDEVLLTADRPDCGPLGARDFVPVDRVSVNIAAIHCRSPFRTFSDLNEPQRTPFFPVARSVESTVESAGPFHVADRSTASSISLVSKIILEKILK
jgi:hypothetical protein